MLGPQRTEETPFTRGPSLGRPRQTSRRDDLHIIRHARVKLSASFATVQTLAAPSLRAPVSFRTIARRLAEGYLILRVLAMTPTHGLLRLEWCRTQRD
ncbi:transposable element Tcb2 transposase [Trichonephila clavipes]|nr:transposable element Tcb2 transposase [Trichonephila clavipes]